MRNRIITVPKDKKAEHSLDYDEARENQLIEWLLLDNEFDHLWEAGIFDLINDTADSNIDDFEAESITETEGIKKVVEALKMRIEISNTEIRPLLFKVIRLFEEALSRNTSIHFFF